MFRSHQVMPIKIRKTQTWLNQDFHPVCLGVPALWSKQKCWQSGWYWWVSPTKKTDGWKKNSKYIHYTVYHHVRIDHPAPHPLVFAVVSGDGPMSSFSLDSLPVRAHEHRCHESQRTETWRQHTANPPSPLDHKGTRLSLKEKCQNKRGLLTLSQDVRLHVTIVILASPHESSGRLQDLSHHVVNETVLVPDLQLFKLWLVVPGDMSMKMFRLYGYIVLGGGSGWRATVDELRVLKGTKSLIHALAVCAYCATLATTVRRQVVDTHDFLCFWGELSDGSSTTHTGRWTPKAESSYFS